MSFSDVTPNGEFTSKSQGLEAFAAVGAPHAARGQPELRLNATIKGMRLEAQDDLPEIFVNLQVSWNGNTQEVVLGESDRLLSIIISSSKFLLTLYC